MTETNLDSLLAAIEQIAPVLHEHRTQNEEQRSLAEPVVEAMTGMGLYRVWIPKAYGGMEADPVTGFGMFEAVARIDSAAAWNLVLSAGASLFAPIFPNSVDEWFSKPKGIFAGALNPPGKAIPVEGGYRVTSRTPFVSGCQNAEWIVGPAQIVEGNDIRRSEFGMPIQIVLFYPPEDAQIIDNWDTLGMRGTGSHDVALNDAFVPRHRTGPLVPWQAVPKGLEGPLFRYTIWPAVAAMASVAFGIAQAAIDELVELAEKKTPAYTSLPLRERPVAQSQVAEAEAKLGSARAYLYEAFREFWSDAQQGHMLPQKQKDKIQLASTHGIQAAAEAVDLVYKAAGASGIRREKDFERHFRDVHVITQHAFISASRFQSIGRAMFGLPSDWPFAPF
jgi:alkylation response protein AidB-like acyl-CoA dehydrogenase